jgi:hypothetical protein
MLRVTSGDALLWHLATCVEGPAGLALPSSGEEAARDAVLSALCGSVARRARLSEPVPELVAAETTAAVAASPVLAEAVKRTLSETMHCEKLALLEPVAAAEAIMGVTPQVAGQPPLLRQHVHRQPKPAKSKAAHPWNDVVLDPEAAPRHARLPAHHPQQSLLSPSPAVAEESERDGRDSVDTVVLDAEWGVVPRLLTLTCPGGRAQLYLTNHTHAPLPFCISGDTAAVTLSVVAGELPPRARVCINVLCTDLPTRPSRFALPFAVRQRDLWRGRLLVSCGGMEETVELQATKAVAVATTAAASRRHHGARPVAAKPALASAVLPSCPLPSNPVRVSKRPAAVATLPALLKLSCDTVSCGTLAVSQRTSKSVRLFNPSQNTCVRVGVCFPQTSSLFTPFANVACAGPCNPPKHSQCPCSRLRGSKVHSVLALSPFSTCKREIVLFYF